MNLRNLFRRQQPDNSESIQSVHTNVTGQEILVVQNTGQDNVVEESDNMAYSQVNQHDESCLNVQNNRSVSPWIVRDAETFSHEQSMMKQHWPGFSLEVIDDSSSPFHGSTCWSGKLKPGLYENMEWEILAIYNGIGGGCGDWSGAITMYFISPLAEQIVETLGYTPACMQEDNDGGKILNNLRPIQMPELGAANAIDYAFTFCETIEKICVGQLPENTLRTNDYLREHTNV